MGLQSSVRAKVLGEKKRVLKVRLPVNQCRHSHLMIVEMISDSSVCPCVNFNSIICQLDVYYMSWVCLGKKLLHYCFCTSATSMFVSCMFVFLYKPTHKMTGDILSILRPENIFLLNENIYDVIWQGKVSWLRRHHALHYIA